MFMTKLFDIDFSDKLSDIHFFFLFPFWTPMYNCRCRNDYVEVIVIDYYNVQHVHGRYCGDVAPPNFTTMQYALDIIFQSSVTKHHQGFRGTYQFIKESIASFFFYRNNCYYLLWICNGININFRRSSPASKYISW